MLWHSVTQQAKSGRTYKVAKRPSARNVGDHEFATPEQPFAFCFSLLFYDDADNADEPTQDDARKAIGTLDSLLTEFPFVDRGSRSAALSGLITPVVRGALKCVPGHSTSSPEPGTGKSYRAIWRLA